MDKRLLKLSILVTVLISILVGTSARISAIREVNENDTDLACTFYQTKNISSGHEQPDGSWLHQGVSYPVGHFMIYKFIKYNGTEIIPVQPHVRGCYCLQRPCISACCDPNELINWYKEDGDGWCRKNETFFDKVMWEIETKDEKREVVDVLEKFHWSYKRPNCRVFFLSSDIPDDKWILWEVSN